MISFKLARSQSYKSEAKSAGALLLVLGIVVGALFHFLLGAVLFTIGVVLVIGGLAATE